MFALAACAPDEGHAADTEFEQAVRQARESLEEFKVLLESPDPTRTFVALKVRFTSLDGEQDIWVDNVTYEDGKFHGLMGDDLPALRLELGERVDVPVEDILDWMIVEDGRLIGGYTIRLAYSRMTPEEKEFFLKDAGYSIDE
jgi:uncharacterized protein YegJ (DUF2314 family)